jgi:transposase
VAAGPDGAAVRAGHAGGEDRRGDVHQRGPGPGRDPQLQQRRLRLPVPEVQGRTSEGIHASRRREIKKIAKSKPAEHGLPFSAWSLAKLADFLVAEGVVDDISHEGLRILLREEGVSFQRVKTWKTSRDPDYTTKKARVEHLYAIADGEVIPEEGEPEVIFCMDEFGPLYLQPHPDRQWAERGGKHKDPDREPRPRRRATYTRPHGVRHLFAAYDLGKDQLHGHIKTTKNRTKSLEFCRYLRSLHPADVRIAIVCDTYSPHLTTKRCRPVADWAEANNVEIAHTPTNSSWLNRIEAHFTALRHFALDSTDPQPHGPGQHDPPQHHLVDQARRRRATAESRQQGERCLMRH